MTHLKIDAPLVGSRGKLRGMEIFRVEISEIDQDFALYARELYLFQSNSTDRNSVQTRRALNRSYFLSTRILNLLDPIRSTTRVVDFFQARM